VTTLYEEIDRLTKEMEEERKDREAFEAKTREVEAIRTKIKGIKLLQDAKLEAERINKEEILRFEQKKKEREEAEAKEKERQEEIRPDREKLITYAQTLQNVFKPHVNDPKADSIMNDAARDLRLLTNRIIRRAEEL